MQIGLADSENCIASGKQFPDGQQRMLGKLQKYWVILGKPDETMAILDN